MSIKILLADDSITIQKVIGIIFGGEEYSLTVVDNGKAAIDRARDVTPDVLLIDALMPDISGYEVCEAIRATPALSQKPILLLTGSFEPFDEPRARNCGADDVLAKPFESQQIITKVKELYTLGISRASAASQPEPQPAAPSAMPSATAAPSVSVDDIWGAFTPAAEPPPAPAPDTIGSEWVPADERTFVLEEEAAAELPETTASALEPPGLGDTFGEISFGDEPAPVAAETALEAPSPDTFAEPAPSFEVTATPAFAEPVAQPDTAGIASGFAEPLIAPFSPTAESVPPVLTEEQLRSALAAVSQNVIERIVWEVVPDLAEALIKDAIRKIKEGA